MAMLMLILTLVVAFLGGLAGAALGQLIRHPTHKTVAVHPAAPPPIDPETSAAIDQAATEWAAAQGRPVAAGELLAEKLRLALGLRGSPKPFDQGNRRWRL